MTDALTPPTARSLGTPRDTGKPVARLFARLTRLRRELAVRARHRRTVLARFRKTIEPREQRLADAVLAETGLLIDRYDPRALDRPRQTLLGLWIEENLDYLQRQSWLDAVSLEPVQRRWAAVLGAGRSPTDRHLAALAARRESSRDAEAKRADERIRQCESTVDSAQDREAARATRPDGHTTSDDTATPGCNSRPADDAPGTSTGTHRRGRTHRPPADRDQRLTRAGVDAMAATLFRRLARELHPDRELDEARRPEKDRLMQRCIDARRRGDVAELIDLYDRYVSDLNATDDAVTGALVPTLTREISRLERLLAGTLSMDPHERGILEHYEDRDTTATLARMDRHRDRLDAEIDRRETRAIDIRDEAAFDRLLEERRRIEFDRMTIGEMTGAESF